MKILKIIQPNPTNSITKTKPKTTIKNNPNTEQTNSATTKIQPNQINTDQTEAHFTLKITNQ